MTMQVQDSASMVILPYTPRADSDARGYHDWLRDVDNPFFNSVEGILHYTNWKVVRAVKGATSFSHFDFMIMESLEKSAQVWANDKVVDFAAGWTQSWGADPDNADLSVNYLSAMAARTGGKISVRGDRVWLGLNPGPAAAESQAEIWGITQPMVGTVPFESFCFQFGEQPPADADAWAETILEGVLIAAP